MKIVPQSDRTQQPAEQGRQHQRPSGSKIFIGHGRSPAWRDLKDFIVERLKLPYDEFNAESAAGIPNTVRLKQMLDDAAFAFLVLTAEDERADGKVQARMNVVHEAGLFQGRLSFEKAIILLEDGCEEFSNITGLGQIRFPAGSISSKFEEIRRVLEREGIIQKI
jgi:predicted nucleotide-binding protein